MVRNIRGGNKAKKSKNFVEYKRNLKIPKEDYEYIAKVVKP